MNLYWSGGRAACIVYDSENVEVSMDHQYNLCCVQSFEKVKSFWLPEARKMLGKKHGSDLSALPGPHVPLLLAAVNKGLGPQVVNTSTGLAFANGHSMQFAEIEDTADCNRAMQNLMDDACKPSLSWPMRLQVYIYGGR